MAQELVFIKRNLNVRFPVYVMVTKCDLLEGFQGFLDNFTDPISQRQMFGWSNPDPLDKMEDWDAIQRGLQELTLKHGRGDNLRPCYDHHSKCASKRTSSLSGEDRGHSAQADGPKEGGMTRWYPPSRN
jgi:hypothetical protein